MTKYFKKMIAIICCAVIVMGVASFTACSSSKNESYSVTYVLNYDDVPDRTVVVPHGANAVNWKPRRSGYELLGWYTDNDLTIKFNFAEPVEKALKVYAKWNQVNEITVTFDGNYGGKYKNTVVSAVKDKEIDELLAPQVSRLGHIFTGWYKDSACTDKWDFYTDKPDGDITLYAGYRRDSSMKLGSDGKPVYENVTVNVWIGMGYGSGINDNVLWNLAKNFNKDSNYKGKIKVNVTYSLSNQDAFSLRFQKTPNKNETEKQYYSVDEIYTLAGIDYSPLDWYATGDSTVEGRLSSVPLIAGVPFVIYNKALMTKYNSGNGIPSTYTQFSELLQKAYNGEHSKNAGFKSIVTGSSNTWIEATSYAAFAQNGAEYFEYANGKVANTWATDDKMNAATTALTNTYDMLGVNGKNHGFQANDDWLDSVARDRVAKGNALMGIVSWPQAIIDICENKNIGVMPLSGMFADGEYKDRIPVHSLGLSFYKAQNLTTTELAAAAVFADYVSKNSYLFAQNGWYPVRKSVIESDEFQQSEHKQVKVLRQIGDPNNFYTLDGTTDTIMIVTDIAAKMYLLPTIQGNSLDAEAFAALTARLKTSILNA